MAARRESAYPAAIPRRLATISALLAVLLATIVLSPVLVLVAGMVDGVRGARGWPTVRLVGFLLAYSAYETAGVVRSGWIWISQPLAQSSWIERNHRLQVWWVRSLIRAARPVLGLRLEVEADSDLGTGPLIVVSRHVSLVDALLPAHVLGVGEDLRLRYVLTRGLRLDPCLDIAGHRLPNHFINRRGTDPKLEFDALEALAGDMAPNEATVIFPEGGLFTEARRERVLDHLERAGSDRLDAARSLQQVLLPRPGGTLALMRSAPEADVVVLAHKGFEPLGSLKVLWRTLPLTEPVRLRAERHDRASLPDDDAGRTAWLDKQWQHMDEWLTDGGHDEAGNDHRAASSREARP